MKRIIHFCLAFVIFCTSKAYAQPPNDDCMDAITITDLDGSCMDYDNTGVTEDLFNGSCADGLNNMWFQFTAQGPEVTIIGNFTGDIVEITLVEFNPTPCDFGSGVQLGCDEEKLDFTNLVGGNDYYILITLDAQSEGDVELCVDNPVLNPPVNDDFCSPTNITPNGSCTSGTTVDASPDLQDATCPNDAEASVWYSFTLGAGMNTIDIDYTDLDIPGDVNIALIEFVPDCSGTPFLLDSYCGPSGAADLVVSGLNPGTTYHIQVANLEDDEGTFDICATELGADPCVDNDDCADANIISAGTGDGFTCVDGCNSGASPGPDSGGGGCSDFPNATVWYTVTTDSDAANMTVSVSSDDLDQPQISIFTSPDCNAFFFVDCNTGAGGDVDIINTLVTQLTTYYIAVSDLADNQGDFEICVSVVEDNTVCTTDATLEANPLDGSPPEGPYAPGESVEFCYTINNFNNIACNWLQGIVPRFGNCWSDDSFGPTGSPTIWSIVQPAGSIGTWSWWSEGQVDYDESTSNVSTIVNPITGNLEICSIVEVDCPNTGLSPGDPLPGGWYAVTPGGTDPPEPDCDCNPDNAYGDGPPGGGCPGSQSGWQLCFTLIAKDNSECDTDGDGQGEPEAIDCSVSIMTFADGEIGDWQNISCTGEIPTYFSASLNCCLPPIGMADGDPVICSGGQTAIILTSDVDGSTFTWTVNLNFNVEGQSGGEGNQISQVLTNLSSTNSQFITYTIRALTPTGCLSEPFTFTVEVLPAVVADAGEDVFGCAQGEFQIGGAPTGSGGSGFPYDYDWGDPSLDNIGNPTASPNLTTMYVVTVTDQNGCTDTDDMTLFINPNYDVILDGDFMVCKEEGTTIFTSSADGGSPNYSFDWDNPVGSPGNNDTYVFNTNGVDPGSYIITVSSTDANGCTGEEEVEVTVLSTPETLINSIPNPPALCAGSPNSINFTVSEFGSDGNPNDHVYEWTGPQGESYNGNDIIVQNIGIYVLTITDEFGCSNTNSVEVTEVPDPEPEISGDEMVCPNAPSTLVATAGFDGYLWSTSETNDSISVSPMNVTTYIVTVTDISGCTGTAEFTVTPNTGPEPDITGSLSFCTGGTTTLDAGNNFETYDWGNGDIDQTLDVSIAGDYSVIVTDINGCSGTDIVTVEELPFLTPNIGGDLNICPEVSMTDLDAGTGFETYDWGVEGDTQIISVGPGDYSVTVTDSQGCTGESSVSVILNTPPDPIIDGGIELCPDGDMTTLDAGSNYASYAWSTNGTGQTINVTVDGIYNVTVTDDEGCTGESSVEVMLLMAPEPVIDGELSFCIGDMTTLTTEAGYDLYELDQDNNGSIDVTSSDPLSFDIDDERTIRLIVTDSSGCTGSTNVSTVFFTSPQTTLADTANFCLSGNVTVNAEGGFASYEWQDDQNMTLGNNQSFTTNVEGDYILIVTDANGCTGTTTIFIKQSDQLTPVIQGENSICDGLPIDLDAGGGYENYDWSTTDDAQLISISSAGTYIVTVSDLSGCSGVDSIIVTESTTPIAEITSTIRTCNNPEAPSGTVVSFDDQVVVGSASGGWTDLDGAGVDLNNTGVVDFIGVAEGTYRFNYTTNTAVSPCVNPVYVMSVIVEACLCPGIGTPSALCNSDGILDLTTLQMSPDAGVWTFVSGPGGNPVSGTSFDPNGLPEGDYTISFVFDDPMVGCDLEIEVIVPVFDEPSANVVSNSEACNNIDAVSGTIFDFTAMISGDPGTWNDLDGTGVDLSNPSNVDFLGIPDGLYNFTYITNNAIAPCADQSYNLTIDVKECLCPSVITSPTGPFCSSGSSIIDLTTLEVTPESGSWSFVSGPGGNPVNNNQFDPTGLVAGDYIVRFTLDIPQSGCADFSEQTITIIAPPEPGTANQILTLCVGNTDVVALADLLDGEDFGGQWIETSGNPSSGGAFNSGLGTFDITSQNSGPYSFEYIVPGLAPCNDESETVEVIIELLPMAVAGLDQELDCDMPVVFIGDIASESGNDIRYSWSEANGAPIANPDDLITEITQEGIYTLVVTNITTGCFSTDEVIVTTNADFPSLTVEAIDPICFGETNGLINITSTTGGSGNYQYSIDNGITWISATEFGALGAGTYTVLVRDDSGCEAEQIIVLAQPTEVTADIGANIVVAESSMADFSLNTTIVGSEIGNIIWTVDDSTVCAGPACLEYSYLATSSAVVCVSISDLNGCSAEDCVEVRVQKIRNVYVPSVFSPNEDGANDFFYIQGGQDIVSISNFRIYDRWGELVFEKLISMPNVAEEGWNGKYIENYVLPGVYVYYAEVLYDDDDVIQIAGDVTLLR